MNTCQTYKRPIYYCRVAEAPILGQSDKHETTTVGSQRTSGLIKVCKSAGQTLISQTRSVDRLLKLSCILLVKIFY